MKRIMIGDFAIPVFSIVIPVFSIVIPVFSIVIPVIIIVIPVFSIVIPAQAGIHIDQDALIPAFAGMTVCQPYDANTIIIQYRLLACK